MNRTGLRGPADDRPFHCRILRDDERLALHDDADAAIHLVRLEDAHLLAVALDLGARGLDELIHFFSLESLKKRQFLQIQIVDSHPAPS